MIQKWLEFISDYGLMWFLISLISFYVLTKIAGAVIALKRSLSFAFLPAQGNRVLQSCTERKRNTHTHTKISLCNFARQ